MARRAMKKYKEDVGDYVGASIGLGVGSAVLGGMGQGGLAGTIISPAGRMMGVVGTGMGAKAVLGIMGEYTKKAKKKNVRNRNILF